MYISKRYIQHLRLFRQCKASMLVLLPLKCDN